jgi:hypothetical protein
MIGMNQWGKWLASATVVGALVTGVVSTAMADDAAGTAKAPKATQAQRQEQKARREADKAAVKAKVEAIKQ